MFTGIVEEIGYARRWEGSTLTIDAVATLESSRVGDSIAVLGACLTITSREQSSFTVDISPETERCTNLGLLRPGAPVNLERPLTYGGRVGGHLVQGHVDGTGTITTITSEREGYLFAFTAPPSLLELLVEKGFVAIDGISLTAVECTPTTFSVAVIPYTYKNTVLGSREPGDTVNIEVDILAKYVERLLHQRGERDSTGD